ncbi:unnamed protein product [Angiostrongylus costaricensis]|uniref:LRRCT domain-containing protein n=1 Tax=Angiostrongylus costaricensis TaxID=334426 RepID=A0A0R3PV78_ANGCS|nr:unnamed protein product [Angiostrongylus costaricensis]
MIPRIILALIPVISHTVADICSHCSCDEDSKSVTCSSPSLLVRTVSLLPWIEELRLVDLNMPYPPHFVFHPTLQVLHINRCGLQELSAHTLLPLPNLVVLNLADNHLTTLPKNLLRSLKHLRILNLARNQIANISHLSNMLAENVVLEKLDLSENPISFSTVNSFILPSVQLFLSHANLAFINSTAMIFHPSEICPKEVGCRILPLSRADLARLDNLDVSENILEVDISALNALSNANYLDFSHTHLPLDFTIWLEEKSRVKYLNLSNAKIHLYGDSWSVCGRELKQLDISGLGLKRLQLNPNCVLKTVFARNNLLETSHLEGRSLEQLHIDRNLFTDWLIPPPGVILENLRSLTISSNLLTYIPPHALSYFPNLQHLDVSRNQINQIDHLAFPSLGMQLISIDLSFNKLSILPHPVLPSLNYLDISSNEIVTLDPMFFIAMPLLQHLKLTNNSKIFSKCVEQCWLDHLDELTGLIDLDLSHCALSRTPPLSHLSSLRSLILRGNQIVDVNAAELPPNLRILDLGENRLHFTKNLSRLHSLRDLRVDTNPLRCDCSLHDIIPYLINQTQVSDPQLYYCFSGSWQYPLVPYLASTTSCTDNSTAQFVPMLATTFALFVIIVCLLLLSVVGYRRCIDNHAYRLLATDSPRQL